MSALRPENLPVILCRDFLGGAMAARVLQFALDHESEFAATTVGAADAAVRPGVRVSRSTNRLGPLKDELRAVIRTQLPSLMERLRMRPFAESRIEVEMVAHGDGAFYRRHIDTLVGDTNSSRALSAVYYFHNRPQAFRGGALRLYRFNSTDPGEFLDIAPEHDLLAAFPAFIPHEVMPVACPANRFADHRFAINIWVHVERKAGG